MVKAKATPIRTIRKLKPLPERRVKARSHSGSSDSGSGTDWFSDALTPERLKPVREYVEIELGEPVEPDPVREAKEKKKVVTEATHRTLLERYIQITEVS